MKTLVNKNNPQIRITAPEVEEYSDWYVILELNAVVEKSIWALVEEEQPEGICSKCVYYKKDDGYCYYPHGGMKRRINEHGVYECTAFWEREQEEQKPEVDLEKEIKKHTDLFQADIEYPLRLTAIKFYELGRKGGSK